MRKYLEIENSSRKKYIKKFLDEFPQLKDAKYILTEKIDGTNIRICFKSDKTIVLGSRNNLLLDGDHFGLKEILKEPDYKKLINKITQIAVERGKEIMLVGELFGEGINNRLNYGKKRILFFDMYIDDKLTPQEEFFNIMAECELIEFCVPILCKIQGLSEALEYPVKFKSKLCDNFGEGLVIKPLSDVFYHGYNCFYLKNKNPEFEDRPKRKKGRQGKTGTKNSDSPSPLLEYINRNRVIDMLSKEGEIKSKKELGKYVKLIREDALSDFIKDHPRLKLEDDQIKSVNRVISRILFEFL